MPSNTVFYVCMGIMILTGIVVIPLPFIINKRRNKNAWIDGYEHASHIHGTPTDTDVILANHVIKPISWQMQRGEMFTKGYMTALEDLGLPYSEIDQQECLHNKYYAQDNALRVASSVSASREHRYY